MRLDRDQSLLLVIDVQAKLAPATQDHERVVARTQALISAAELFGIPKVATEHCANKIGALIEPLRKRLAPDEIFAKTAFAATDHPEFMQRLARHRRSQIVMTGMEAHVCVMQAALGLRAAGMSVAIVADACGSRPSAQLDRQMALQRMAAAECVVAGTDTVLFEWTRAPTDERFRSILALVKSL